jgi:hypothetical protein
MENNNEKNRKVATDDSVTDTDQETPRNEENVEKNSSSKVTSSFVKDHGRSNNSLGDSHEPGTLPGTGV